MSQERLAEILGVTFQQVQKYEKGINRVAASRLFELATALEVGVGYFFEGLAPEGSGIVAEEESAVFDAIASPEGLQLVTLFAAIKNPRLRRRVVELVRVIVEDSDHDEANAGAVS
ncbi:MAG: helix-turn-helix domain-containing protein [Alphaproteobacteria bacterium]|nr:helix-turn-helix domain-containing protein [Alphaproteobacteria bacterium]